MTLHKFFSYFYFLPLLAEGMLFAPESTGVADLGLIKLFYSARGPKDGKPVVLMHGNGGSHKSMTTQAIQLALRGYRVYCPDSRGQGSNPPLDEYHYSDMAEDCYLFIKALGLERPAVGGWSDGGINALMLEMSHPGTCSSIVAAGANLKPDCGEGFEEFKEWILSEGTPLAMMMLNEPYIEPESLNIIKCPALVTVGSEDLISVEHTRLIADNIPNSTLAVVEGASHSSYIKRNPRLGRLILNFFSQIGY